jgi:hypothetical protein
MPPSPIRPPTPAGLTFHGSVARKRRTGPQCYRRPDRVRHAPA